MTGKRIEFPKKPLIKNTDQFIDAWVSGNHKQEQLKSHLVAIINKL